ncbi:MAG: LytTR family DNA-binding domain-containing protein [Amylibacter sp.]
MIIDGVSGALAGPFVTVIVYAINTMTFTQSDSAISAPSIFALLIYCTAIAIAVFILIGLLQGSRQVGQDIRSMAPPILDRLPFEKRASLASLQAQDHYVRVATTKGRELLLMRIADAINEVGDTIGFQTHRAYWVAQDQISKSKQLGEWGLLTLHDGSEIPVSRKYLQNLKSGGFL